MSTTPSPSVEGCEAYRGFILRIDPDASTVRVLRCKVLQTTVADLLAARRAVDAILRREKSINAR